MLLVGKFSSAFCYFLCLPQYLKHNVCNTGGERVAFNVSTNTVRVIWETDLQVKRPNQQYQSYERRQK